MPATPNETQVRRCRHIYRALPSCMHNTLHLMINMYCICRSFSCQLCITSKPSAAPQHQLAACCHSPSWNAWSTSQRQLCSCCSNCSKPAQMWPHAAELSSAMPGCACSRAPPAHQMLCWQCSLLLRRWRSCRCKLPCPWLACCSDVWFTESASTCFESLVSLTVKLGESLTLDMNLHVTTAQLLHAVQAVHACRSSG